ncbi:hypothetical protein ATCC90586_005971 [Pythium insidiosum]|nr:hypothetical protein ATCC90586_005971 [Pythium insidiosum]
MQPHTTSVDPAILKKLSASVTHFHGPRKNLSYVISVETLGASRLVKDRDSSQFVARSFEEFRRFRRSLLARVRSGRPDDSGLMDALFSKAAAPAKCECQGRHGCAFDATRTFLERLRFTRMPFFGIGLSEENVAMRQNEMNNFLRMIFAIVHRIHPSAWRPECLFLQDILEFLDVEQAFFEQVEHYLSHKRRQLTLDGWKAYTVETYGHGIRTQPAAN